MKVKLLPKYKKKIASHINTSLLFDEVADATEGDVATITIEGLVSTLKTKKSFLLSQDVERFVRFVSFDKGLLLVNLEDGYPRELIKNLNNFFTANDINIKVEFSSERGQDTLEQKKKAIFKAQLDEVSKNPILKEILDCFTNSVVANIEDL